jgi:HK97 family phage portal protein
MRLFGYEISRARPAPALAPASGGRGWFPIVREPYLGAWQQNAELTLPTALANPIVYACVTLIATDIGKLALRLVAKDDDGIWHETTNPAYSPVLRKPNRYQTIVKFVEQWMISKLTAGNTYVLKQRDERGVVSALYVLDPAKVTPLVAPDGAVYYQLATHDMPAVDASGPPVIAPAREIIHDKYATLFHPLIGVPPLYAGGLAAQQGQTMAVQAELFFRTGSKPGGILTAPGPIGKDTAERAKKDFEEKFSGPNIGRIAVLGDGLKYEGLAVNAAESQLMDQFQWTAQQICTCFHVPPALLDLGESAKLTTELEALLQKYHSQCIQSLLINFETVLDDGLELKPPYGTEFDIDDLIWMVTATKVQAAKDAIGAGALSPDEARRKYFGVGKVTGGSTPYMQQQNFSLAALAERDADAPFSKPDPAPPAVVAATPSDDEDEEKAFVTALTKSLEGLDHAA